MPPIPKIKKEDILNMSLEIVEKEGLQGLNTRKIAEKLNTSVIPIFHNFKNMEELKCCVMEKIQEVYQNYMDVPLEEESAYKKMGLSYIKFAKEKPEFFKILFMNSSKFLLKDFILEEAVNEALLKVGQKFTGFTLEEQKKFHLKVVTFTHGIACLVMNKTVLFTEEEISELLGNTVYEMLLGMKEKKNECI